MKLVKYITLFVIMGVCVSWNDPIEKTLARAGNNRVELEKVLNHYQNSPKSLGCLSANFLIENMPYCYSLYGNSISQYYNIYGKVGASPREARDELFHQAEEKINLYDAKYYSDIRTIQSDYLIRSIDEAVKVWNM